MQEKFVVYGGGQQYLIASKDAMGWVVKIAKKGDTSYQQGRLVATTAIGCRNLSKALEIMAEKLDRANND